MKLVLGLIAVLAWLPLIAEATPGTTRNLSEWAEYGGRADQGASAVTALQAKSGEPTADDDADAVLERLERIDGSMVDHLRALRDRAANRPEALRLENVPELEEAIKLMRAKLGEVERMADDVLRLADAVGAEGATTRGELSELRDLFMMLADAVRQQLAGVGNEADPAAKRVIALWKRELAAHERNVELIEHSAEVITSVVMENHRAVKAVRMLGPTFPRLRKSVDGLERLGKVIDDVEAFRKSAQTILEEIDLLLDHYESVAETAGSAIDRLSGPMPKPTVS